LVLKSKQARSFFAAQAKLSGTIFCVRDTFETSRAKFEEAGSSEYTTRAARAAKSEKVPTFAPMSTTTESGGIVQCLV
jgi:hypothetical protein